MNDRRVSSLLEAGVPIGLPTDLKSPNSNPFLQSITDVTADSNVGPISMASLKSEWMMRELEACETEFVMHEDFVILAGSWNVNGTVLPGNLDVWLANETGSVPDVVFIGLQEVDQRTQAYIYEGSEKEQFWNQTLQIALDDAYPEHKFQLLVSRLYVGIYGAVFVRREIYPNISHVAWSFAACGLMGLVGNKGAVGIRFRYQNDYLCFINSHLAAHIPAVERRNQDASEIVRRTLFNAPYTSFDPPSSTVDSLMREYKSNPGPASIWDASHIIWLGDLNYRIPIDATLMRDLLDAGLYKELLLHDQLLKEREKPSVVWSEFKEAPINFAPTFKYDPGTDEFDTSEKNRTPAWCDRILYKSNSTLNCLEYTSVPQLLASDHKPVRMLMRAQVNSLDRTRFEKVYERLLKQLDQLENELIPATQLQTHSINFGQLVYQRLVQHSVEILNIGQVLCQFRIIPPGESETPVRLCKPWVRIKPLHGIIMPGESRSITFSFYIDGQTGRDVINSQNKGLEDIIVVHVDYGRDHFIHVSGSMRPTPFGLPLSETSMEAYIKESFIGKERKIRKVPKPVWLLVDFIIKYGIQTESLFLASGSKEQIDLIQDALDMGTDLPLSLKTTESGLLSVGEMLIRYLDSIPISVIPQGHYYSVLAASDKLEEARILMGRLPEEHKSLFDYLCTFLGRHFLPRNRTVDLIDLAYVFAPVMIKPSNGQIETVTSAELHKLALFLALFLK